VFNRLARRPVVLKLLLDCEVEAIDKSNLNKVSDFYKLVTEEWSSREAERLNPASNPRDKLALSGFIMSALEMFAAKVFYSGKESITLEEAAKWLKSIWLDVPPGLRLEVVVNMFLSCIFLEVSIERRLKFKHRSFLEFHVARKIIRKIKEGDLPDLGEVLPSIEILDFLRELFDEQALGLSLKLLDQSSASTNLKIALLIALRQFPEVGKPRFKKYATDPGEPFAVRRVATMSLAEHDKEYVERLVRFHKANRQAQYENIHFLMDIWKANRDEIVARTRFRLENLKNPDRRYWQGGRAVHISTLGQVGGMDEVGLISEFLNDPDTFVSCCAEQAIQEIKLRNSPAARNLDERMSAAFTAAREAGDVLIKRFRKNNPVLSIDAHDVTTQADVDAQHVILSMIREKFPHDRILAEEESVLAAARSSNSDYRWIIDPLDGTVNFVAGFDRFSVAMAIEYKGAVVGSIVYAPVKRNFYWARQGFGAFDGDKPIEVPSSSPERRGLVSYSTSCHDKPFLSLIGGELFKKMSSNFRSVRLFGCASLDFCDLACNKFDGLIKLPGCYWDFAPGIFLLKEAGGAITHYCHPESSEYKFIISGTSTEITETLVRTLKEILEYYPVDND
jgi:myo-inositol-1(or 4)-monophosphatase